MIRAAIFSNEIDARAYSDKVHAYLQDNRPGYSAAKWADPVPAPDGLTWIVQLPIEENENKWPVAIDTAAEKSKTVGITDDLGDTIDAGKYYLYQGRVLKCVDENTLSFVQKSDVSPTANIDIIKTFHVDADEIKAFNNDADDNIKKLVGKVKNYVADLTDGVRTNKTDSEVDQLIADGNIIITNE